MRVICLLSLASLVFAADFPFHRLRNRGHEIDLKSSELSSNIDTTLFNENGYKSKAVGSVKYRQRREVSELANEYIPPNDEFATEVFVDVSLEEPQESAILGDNGYEYRTVQGIRYHQRSDVSEIGDEYLTPSEKTTTEVFAEIKSEEEPQKSAVFGNSGHEYKTMRRLKYRQRRDVSEIANEYLPPSKETATEADIKSEKQPQESSFIGSSGYEYKMDRRLKYKQRRNFSESVNEYLPPTEDTAIDVTGEISSESGPQEPAVLGGSVYEYRKYRHRRHVEETTNEVVAEIKSEEEPQESAVLGESGYEYKTARRLKFRQRLDVSEIPNEYLSPGELTTTEVVAEIKPEEKPKESLDLGESGYEYTTVPHLKHRHRRDVSEIPNEYLSPCEVTTTEVVAEIKSEEEPQQPAVLGESGYEYKRVRRLKLRQRRDVSETLSQYLSPVEETTTDIAGAIKSEEKPEESSALGESGYEYKTVRHLKLRQRRDVSEISNEYLRPAEDTAIKTIADIISDEQPQESAVLGDNGYEYKTMRSLKYRQRRDDSVAINK